jgi:hypothetical protein
VAGVEADAKPDQPAPQVFPCPRVVLAQGLLVRKVEIDSFAGPVSGDIGGRTDRSRAPTYHYHRPGGCETVVVSGDLRADLGW